MPQNTITIVVPACAPGEVNFCYDTSNWCRSFQTCLDDGSGFSPCECSVDPEDAGAQEDSQTDGSMTDSDDSELDAASDEDAQLDGDAMVLPEAG